MDRLRLLTTDQAAHRATTWRRHFAPDAAITPATIRQWRARGHLRPADTDDAGRPLYTERALARAEHATRGRALRLLGRPDTTPHPEPA